MLAPHHVRQLVAQRLTDAQVPSETLLASANSLSSLANAVIRQRYDTDAHESTEWISGELAGETNLHVICPQAQRDFLAFVHVVAEDAHCTDADFALRPSDEVS